MLFSRNEDSQLRLPFDDLPIQPFGDGDMGQSRRWCGPVPIFFSWLKPNDAPRANLLDRLSPALDPTEATRHNQCLAEWMAVPCNPSTRLKGDTGTIHMSRIGSFKRGIDEDRAGKRVG